MYSTIIPSPLGDLIAIASDDHLLMLEFADSEELEEKVSKLLPLVGGVRGGTQKIPHLASPTRGGTESRILTLTILQLSEYFEWTRKHFDIPLSVDGTDFQKDAWKWLEKIPYGETRSYGEQAKMISRPKAVRAIGWANHNNRIVIIIPCHRVIGKSGKLVGYGGWLDRKIWLLEHEKKYR